MNDSSTEMKVCKICGNKILLSGFASRKCKGKIYYSNMCKECKNCRRRQARRNRNIEEFMADESMKIQRHYKEIRPERIFPMEHYGIAPAAEDEIFVKLLDYKDAWISNYGRVLTRYGANYCLMRKNIVKTVR